MTEGDRPAGLTRAEAARRLAHEGPNALPEAASESRLRQLARQFRSPLISILLFALVVDVVVWGFEGAAGWPLEALAIAVILLLNAGLGMWQERRAGRAIERLERLAEPRVWALRDGTLERVDGRELVPGDAIRLEAGDRVPADLDVHSAASLAVDESVLTGESLPVDRAPGDELLAGTLVVRGTAWLVVARTGAGSAMGRMATMLGGIDVEPTPLERRLVRFGHRIARWIIAIAVVIALVGLAGEGLSGAGRVLLFAVALAVAAIPEGLPAVLSVTLALGVERMAKRKAVVRTLSAVEALGSVTVIATDKTGTLTENRMEVRELDAPDPGLALRAMVLAGDADPATGAGDPLELALLRDAAANGVDVAAVRGEFERDAERPFDSSWKFMRVTGCGGPDRRRTSWLKGAPEVLLERCDLDETERADWLRRIDEHAARGFRLLALASGPDDAEQGLRWLGVALLWDPPREEVASAVAEARRAGVRVLMVTGDHPATARTVAGLVGIGHERVLTGSELDELTDDELQNRLPAVDVFARVDPGHKLRIVDALRRQGEIVAMTGDGVNDAPALKRADVGIAMGERGSDVSREVADLVLLDDNFATIVAAVEEGRSIYENIRKFLRFLFSTNLSEVLVVTLGAFAALLVGLRDEAGHLLLPLTAAQLLWINLVSDGAPALALGLDRNPGVMDRPPQDPASPLLDRASLQFVLGSGAIKAALALGLLWLLPATLGLASDATRGATFLFMASGQLLFAYPSRYTGRPLPVNPAVHVAVAIGFLAQLAVAFTPGLMVAFDVLPLPPVVWAWIVAGVLVAWLAGELVARATARSARVDTGTAGDFPADTGSLK